MFAFGSPAKVTPANLAAAMKHLLAMGHPAKFWSFKFTMHSMSTKTMKVTKIGGLEAKPSHVHQTTEFVIWPCLVLVSVCQIW